MINLTVVIDNDEALKKLRELQAVAKTTTSSVVSDSERMDAAMQKFKNTLMQVTAGIGMIELAKQVAKVRGEFQQLEVAFETMLGSKEKADKLMNEMVELAAKTPFGLQDVAGAAKMLLAYGSTAEEVGEEITMLGNIASGLSIPLNDLIYLYGTTRTQGQMFTQDLRQFMGRGIPIAEELAKQFGVATNEVGALVTAGKVGFEDVKVALEALTDEGGKFNDLMDKQSQTIDGQISAIQDSIQIMFNEIGKSSEGLINMTLDGVSWMVEHWRELLTILKYVVAVYGSYKAAIILVAAAHRTMAIGKSAIAFIQLATSIRRASEAMTLLNTVTKASPLGLIAAVIGVVGASFIDLGRSAEEASSSIGDASDDAARSLGVLEQAAADAKTHVTELFDKLLAIDTSDDEKFRILSELTSLYPEYLNSVGQDIEATELLTAAQMKLNEELQKRQALARAQDDKNEAERARTDAEGKARAEAEKWIEDYKQNGLKLNDSSRVFVSGWAVGENELTEDVNKFVHDIVEKYEEDNDIYAFYDALENMRVTIGKYYADVKDSNNVTANRIDIAGISEGHWDNILKETKKNKEEKAELLSEREEQYKAENVGKEDERTYSQRVEEAKAVLEKAKKDLEKAIADDDANRVSYYQEQVKQAQDAYDAIAKPYEDYLKEQERLMEEERKQREKIADMNRKLMDDAAQARVDAMEDGFEKEMAQLDLDFDREIRKIEEQEAELRKLQGGKLAQEQIAAFDAMRDKAINDYTNKSTVIIFGDPQDYDKQFKEAEASWDDYLAEYGTFQERLAAIKRNYDRKLADAKTEGEKAAIIRERDALLAEYEVEATGFARNLADKTLSEIETITKHLQEEVDAKKNAYDALDSSDSDTAKALLAEIDILNAKIKALEELTGKASDNLAKDKWDGATEVFQNIAECANEAAEGLEEYDKGLATAFKAMGKIASIGVNLAGAIKGVKTAFDAASKSVSAMEKASAILAVISVAIQAVSALVEMFKGLGEESEIEKTTRLFGELNTEVERLREASRIDSFDGTIFGKDGFGNFNNNLAVMRDALEALEATQERIAKRGKEIVMGNGVENWGDRKVGELEWTGKSSLGIDRGQEWNSAYDSVSNMQVQTKHKTWFTRAKYSSLEELYPELFAGGELSLDALKELQNSDLYKKLSKENRDLIDELIANWQMYEDAVTATEEYLTDIFGDLGSSMTDALVDAFKNGTDAAEAFGEAASDVIERLSTDMIHSAFIQPILDKYDEAINAMNAEDLSPEERMAKLTQLISDMSQEVLATQGMVDEAAQRVREEAEANGIDGVYDSEGVSQSATSKGFEAMSQETGSELNGRFTDIQGQTHRIAEAVEFCRNIQASHLQHLQSVSSTLASIHNDTSLIASHTQALSEIRNDISTIRRSIDNGAL